MAAARSRFAALRRSVVKVITVADPPDYEQPWQTLGATGSTGSGVLVPTRLGPRVLTNAHVVQDATFVELRRYGQARKVVAEIEGLDPDCDLASLVVDDAAFLRGARKVPFGGLPSLGDHVTVLGFPIGGDRLSITEGVVSRIELSTYTQSLRELVTVQIDAAVNAGNSGGPVLRGGKLAGIAFQALEEAENIGYVIPTPVIEHFLRDLQDGTADGFPALGVRFQTLESRSHRRALDLPRGRRGVLVTRVDYEGSSWRILEPGDVLLAIQGVPIADDGTVPFRKDARIEFEHLASQEDVGAEIELRVWREGTTRTVRVPLCTPKPLVPWRTAPGRPSWYAYAGLLFAPLTGAWLESWGETWSSSAPPELLALAEDGRRTSGTREVVVLQKVLADRVNRGYHDFECLRLVKVQGRRIRDLYDVVRLVETSSEPFVRFELANGSQVILDRALAAERHPAIQKRYGLPDDRSADLRGRRPRRG